eukprot:15465755-Alexandrium_andersonii.AAC.1
MLQLEAEIHGAPRMGALGAATLGHHEWEPSMLRLESERLGHHEWEASMLQLEALLGGATGCADNHTVKLRAHTKHTQARTCDGATGRADHPFVERSCCTRSNGAAVHLLKSGCTQC